MSWSSPRSSDDIVAIHAALLPTVNGDGVILLFGGDNHDIAAARGHHVDHTGRFNCRAPTAPLAYVQSPSFDLFCCGHAFMGDGRLLIAGGTNEFPPDAGGPHHERHFDGHRHAVAFNPVTGTLAQLQDMNPEPGNGAAGGGRWYPTLCTIGSGEVLAFQGHPKGDDTRHGNTTPEIYRPGANTWILLQAVGVASVDPILYPRLHLLRDGTVFVSSRVNGFNQNIKVDPHTGVVTQVAPLPDPEYQGFDCASVLLPLVPADDYRPRVLLCGGPRSQLLDLGNPQAGWQDVPRHGATENQGRAHGCATLLPTGDVLFTGGALPNTNDQGGVQRPEVYRAPLNRLDGTYAPGPGRWETIEEPATVLRNYHSSALLMPDGRVWTAGGNSPAQPGVPPTATQKQIEIYDPPYPAGPRPSIASCPSFIFFGEEFTMGVPGADTIGSVMLMRCGSSTHAFNPDQRALWLRFRATSPQTLTATAPPNGNAAPPGPYMLFVVDKQGRPCQYAKFAVLGQMVDDGSRYAARWVKDDGALFVAKHGLTSQQYQDEFNAWVSQGYCLALVNGYTVKGQDHYAAIWEKRDGPAFVARHGLSGAAYQHEFDTLVAQGYRLRVVSGYEVGGQDRYAAIFEKSPGPAWVARHGLSPQQYQQEFDAHVAQGYRLKLVNGYGVGGQERFAAIWEKDNGPPFVARHGLTSQQYQQEFDVLTGQQGFRLAWVSGYRHANEERFAAIWEKSPSPAWVARHGMSAPVYQGEFNRLVGAEGYRLVQVSGY
jgi:hypothetical protein